MAVVILILLSLSLLFPSSTGAFPSPGDIATVQEKYAGIPLGARIAAWAGEFIGVPYDPDPDGEYVTKRAIVADERVDCMYLVFRAAELAIGRTPEESVQVALDKRFHHRGVLVNGRVSNYEDRFRYGEDMIDSGKWGRDVTAELGSLSWMAGTRGRDRVPFLGRSDATKSLHALVDGDLVFFLKRPEKRTSDEIVGHMGVIRNESGKVFLIHAGGLKGKSGRVKKVLLSDYLKTMPFAGIRVSRFGASETAPE